jgi:hypothetical protein
VLNSLKEQSADRHVSPLGHIILIPSRQVFAVFNAACLAEEQHIPIKNPTPRDNRNDFNIQKNTLYEIWPVLLFIMPILCVKYGKHYFKCALLQYNGHRRKDERTTNDLYNTSQIPNDRAT